MGRAVFPRHVTSHLARAPGSRRHAVACLELPAKVLAAGETGIEGNRSNRDIGFARQPPGRAFQAATVQVIDRTGVGEFVAVMGKPVLFTDREFCKHGPLMMW